MWIRQLISEKIFRLKLRSETRQYCYFELTCRCNDLYEANTLLSFWIEPLCYFLALLVTCRQPRSSWLNFLISDLDLPSCCQRNMEAWWWETAKRWQRQHRLEGNIFGLIRSKLEFYFSSGITLDIDVFFLWGTSYWSIKDKTYKKVERNPF